MRKLLVLSFQYMLLPCFSIILIKLTKVEKYYQVNLFTNKVLVKKCAIYLATTEF